MKIKNVDENGIISEKRNTNVVPHTTKNTHIDMIYYADVDRVNY